MKTYYQQFNIGKCKYVVNFHDGESKHKDGSPFFNIRIFKNKVLLNAFIRQLEETGYKYQY